MLERSITWRTSWWRRKNKSRVFSINYQKFKIGAKNRHVSSFDTPRMTSYKDALNVWSMKTCFSDIPHVSINKINLLNYLFISIFVHCGKQNQVRTVKIGWNKHSIITNKIFGSIGSLNYTIRPGYNESRSRPGCSLQPSLTVFYLDLICQSTENFSKPGGNT